MEQRHMSSFLKSDNLISVFRNKEHPGFLFPWLRFHYAFSNEAYFAFLFQLCGMVLTDIELNEDQNLIKPCPIACGWLVGKIMCFLMHTAFCPIRSAAPLLSVTAFTRYYICHLPQIMQLHSY